MTDPSDSTALSTILPSYIDATMMTTFRSCPQKFFREFCQALRTGDLSIDLHAGGVFSATLERFYQEFWTNGCETNVALARAYATFTTEWGDFIIRKDRHPKTPENMWAAVESYIATYPPRTDHVQPYFLGDAPSFEFSFAIPLDFPGFPKHPVSGDPFVYVGRFDLLGKLVSAGELPCVRDEKTAQRLESNWSEKWDLRSQFLGYCWALQHLGIKCNTTVVRGVIITLTMIRQVEAIKTYPQFLIDRWYEQLRKDLNRMVSLWELWTTTNDASAFDYNLGDSCVAYSHCHLMPMCSSPHPENWVSSYEVRRWNPLLRNPSDSRPTSVPLKYNGTVPPAYEFLRENT